MTTITAASANFTRPSDTNVYASGDLIADNTTAGSVHPMQFTLPTSNFKLQRVGLTHTSTATTNASYRLHLYSSGPTVANGDNGVWSTTESAYLGDIDIDCTARAFTDKGQGFGLFATSDVPAYLAVNSSTLLVYGLLEARAAYTPSSAEVITVTLYGETY